MVAELVRASHNQWQSSPMLKVKVQTRVSPFLFQVEILNKSEELDKKDFLRGRN